MRDLSLHLLDIVQNYISARAGEIQIKIYADQKKDFLDNGECLEESLVKKVLSPFTTSRNTRKVGLGIPLFESATKRSSGDFSITSKKYEGTCIKAGFKISHIDRPPLGDVADTMVSLLVSDPEIEYDMELYNTEESFRFSTFEIRQKLGVVPLTEFEVLEWIRGYLNEGIKNIFGGVLDEIIS